MAWHDDDGKLEGKLKSACSELHNASREDAPEKLQDLRKVLHEIERFLSSGTSLDAFFQNVGQSLIAAQQNLDAASEDYVAGTSEAKPALPRVYSIPKASAEFMFRMEDINSTGLNIGLLEDKEEKQQTIKHRVEFEVVAVPPPPELVEKWRQGRVDLIHKLRSDYPNSPPEDPDKELPKEENQRKSLVTKRKKAAERLANELEKERAVILRVANGYLVTSPPDSSTPEHRAFVSARSKAQGGLIHVALGPDAQETKGWHFRLLQQAASGELA